jgi:hypothetical protein
MSEPAPMRVIDTITVVHYGGRRFHRHEDPEAGVEWMMPLDGAPLPLKSDMGQQRLSPPVRIPQHLVRLTRTGVDLEEAFQKLTS